MSENPAQTRRGFCFLAVRRRFRRKGPFRAALARFFRSRLIRSDFLDERARVMRHTPVLRLTAALKLGRRLNRHSSKGKASRRASAEFQGTKRDFLLNIFAQLLPKIWAVFQPFFLALCAAQRILLRCGSASRCCCPSSLGVSSLDFGPLASRRRPFFALEELRCSGVVTQINAGGIHVGPASG